MFLSQDIFIELRFQSMIDCQFSSAFEKIFLLKILWTLDCVKYLGKTKSER
jgi:hypothetical protein